VSNKSWKAVLGDGQGGAVFSLTVREGGAVAYWQEVGGAPCRAASDK